MIYLDLLWGFLKVGLFSFGGAYGAIPLIREVVLDYGWISDSTLQEMIAVSESTPGPIMVNLATYIGVKQGGVWGAILATLAVILPAFLIILLVMVLLKNLLKNPLVQAVLDSVKPCVIGIVLATGLDMTLRNLLPQENAVPWWLSAIVLAVLAAVFYGYRLIRKGKKMSPILLILLSAVLGILVF